jgi:hypothetical protein
VILREVEDLAARTAAAHLNWMKHQKLVPSDQVHDILGADLMGAVFGDKPYLNDAINYYMEHGYKNRPDL